MCASVPRMVLAYGYCPDIVITSTLFHSQKFSHLDNTFYGHPIYEEVHGRDVLQGAESYNTKVNVETSF